MDLRLRLLKYGQTQSFRCAQGLIFLTEFARSVVLESIGKVPGRIQIIPHGVDARFYKVPREQKSLSAFSRSKPFRLLYVSTVDLYKHQWNVAEAVARLRRRGMPIEISFVGGTTYAPAMARLRGTIAKLDAAHEFIRYDGTVSFSNIQSIYHRADAFVFASTCENMPNILLEAMASGLPILCSNRPPMTDILGDAGFYMDPLNPGDIQKALETLVANAELRDKCAELAYERAKSYTWHDCARATFAFIRSMLEPN